MNKLFTKIVGTALGLAMAIGVGVAVASNKEAMPVEALIADSKLDTAVVHDFSSEYSSTTSGSTAASGDHNVDNKYNINFTKISGSNNPLYYANGTAVRIYNKSSITISTKSSSIAKIGKIVFAAGSTTYSTNYGSCSTGTNTFSGSTWTSDINDGYSTVEFTVTGTSRIQTVSIYPIKAQEKGIGITGISSSGLYLKNEPYEISFETTGFDSEPTITDIEWTVPSGAGSISDGVWTTGASAMENVTLELDLKANGTSYHADVTTTIDEVLEFKKNSPKTKFTTDEPFTVGHAFDVIYAYAADGTVAETDVGISYRLENQSGTKIKDIAYNSTKFITDDSGKFVDATYKGVDLTQRYSITVLSVFDNTEGAYYLVNDESELNDGDHVTFFGYYSKDSTTSNFVPTSFNGTKNITAHTVAFDNNAIDGDQVFSILDFVLEDTGSKLANSFAFQVSNNADKLGQYLYANASGSNYIATQASSDDVNARFVIDINNSGVASISATESSNRHVLSANYNTGSPIFSCYTGVQSNNSLYLYKWVSNAEKVGEFISNYMKLDDDDYNTTDYVGLCDAGGENSPYQKAKAAFNNLTTSQRALFIEKSGAGQIYHEAYERLYWWAKANGKSFGTDLNGNENVLKAASVNSFLVSMVDANSTVMIIVIISLVGVTAIGGYLLIRRRKEQ